MADTWYNDGWEGSGGAPIGGVVVGLRGAEGGGRPERRPWLGILQGQIVGSREGTT